MTKIGGVNTPKTAIFCTSLTDVGKLMGNLFAMLGDAQFVKTSGCIREALLKHFNTSSLLLKLCSKLRL